MIRSIFLVLILFGLFATTGRAMTTAEYCQEPVETEFVRLLNQYRVASGVPEVKADQVLSTAAEHHAIDMGQRNVLDHNLGDGTDFGTNINNHGWVMGGWLGEVAAGSYESAFNALNQLKNSPSHNEILLDPKYVSVGVGRYDDGGATQSRYWWVGDFSSAGPQQAVVACGSTPTPVPTRTSTATSVPTRANTATSKSQTPTPVPTQIPTRTQTPQPRLTATPSPTQTQVPPQPTPTQTPTATSTPPATAGPTYTVPDDPTQTPTVAPSRTPKPKVCPTRNPHYPC